VLPGAVAQHHLPVRLALPRSVFLSYLAFRRRLIGRWSRVGAGYALGWLLAAWYLVPQMLLVPQLVAGLVSSVQDVAWLTPLGVLLAPSVALPIHLGSPYIAQPEHLVCKSVG